MSVLEWIIHFHYPRIFCFRKNISLSTSMGNLKWKIKKRSYCNCTQDIGGFKRVILVCAFPLLNRHSSETHSVNKMTLILHVQFSQRRNAKNLSISSKCFKTNNYQSVQLKGDHTNHINWISLIINIQSYYNFFHAKTWSATIAKIILSSVSDRDPTLRSHRAF